MTRRTVLLVSLLLAAFLAAPLGCTPTSAITPDQAGTAIIQNEEAISIAARHATEAILDGVKTPETRTLAAQATFVTASTLRAMVQEGPVEFSDLRVAADTLISERVKANDDVKAVVKLAVGTALGFAEATVEQKFSALPKTTQNLAIQALVRGVAKGAMDGSAKYCPSSTTMPASARGR